MSSQQNRNGASRPEMLLRRKLLLGLAASYRELGNKVGASQTAVRAVLTEQETGIEINRDRMLDDIERALDAIEAETKEVA